MKIFVTAAMVMAITLQGNAVTQPAEQDPLERVYLDAQVIKRVAEVAHRDLPRDLLMRIIEQDIELLRGKQTDGTYQYAHFEPIESGRVAEGFTVKPREEGERLDRNQFRGKNVYKLIVDVPSRRLIVARNRDIYLDRIELSYDDQKGNPKNVTFEVGKRLEAGEQLEFEFPEVASDALATVYARSDTKSANIELVFVKADLVDNAGSPWFGIVQSAKLLQEAIGRRDQTAMQSLATSMAERIETSIGRPPGPSVPATQPAVTGETEAAAVETMPVLEIYLQLERIEDLLTGTPQEREDALERLHKLIRELRGSALDAARRQ